MIDALLSIEELEEQIALAVDIKERIKEQKEIMSALHEQWLRQEQLVISMLIDVDHSSYHTNDTIFSWKEEYSYSVEDKEAFHNYLKGLGIYDELASVNSRTLNALAKQATEPIPGLKQGTPYLKATIRRK